MSIADFKSSRPIKVSNIRLKRAGEDLEVVFDLDWNECWRYPKDKPPGNWNAAWLFVKYSGTQIMTAENKEELGELLAPCPKASRREKEARRAAAIRRFTARRRRALKGEKNPKKPFKFTVQREQHLRTGGRSPGEVEKHVDLITVVETPGIEPGQPTRWEARCPKRWGPAILSQNNSDHHAGAGFAVTATQDGLGVFLHRAKDNPGHGPQSNRDVRLRWTGAGALELPAKVWVHALEMVYVAEGPFEIGDPKGKEGPAACMFDPDENGVFKVSSEAAIEVQKDAKEAKRGSGNRIVWNNAGQNGERGDIPADYPKGYNAFYCMRRQVTQGEYTDFINSLSGHAKTARFPYGGQGFYRFTVFKSEGGQRAATRPNRACNWLSWADASAYLWWAGLRPLTELEYAKACRGPLPAVHNEYAWGTASLAPAYVIVGDESYSDGITGNCNIANAYDTFQGGDAGIGPVRDDAFLAPDHPFGAEVYPPGRARFTEEGRDGDWIAAEEIDLRQATGASYWGIMSLSGNLWEFIVTAGNDKGRSFKGRHGNGRLTSVGKPDDEEVSWPDIDANGTGFRGGSWYTEAALGRVADRRYSTGIEGYHLRSHDTGIRCVRTAPRGERRSVRASRESSRRFAIGT